MSGEQYAEQVEGATTNDIGDFRLTDLKPGSYYVRTGLRPEAPGAAKYGYIPVFFPASPTLESAEPIAIGAGTTRSNVGITVAKERVFTVSVNIIDSISVDGRRDYLTRLVRSDGSGQLTTVWTGGKDDVRSDGSFVIRGVPSGAYLLKISERISAPRRTAMGALAMGEENGSVAPVKIEDSDVSVSIEMPDLAELRGRLKLGTDTDVNFEGFRLMLLPMAPLGRSIQVRLKSDGVFDFKNIEPDHYVLIISKPPQSFWYPKEYLCSDPIQRSGQLTLQAGDQTDCTIIPDDDFGSINGQVTLSDKAFANATVVAIPVSRELRGNINYVRTTSSGANGGYSLPDVIPGDYDVFALQADASESFRALEFADRNRADAKRISVHSRQSQKCALTVALIN